MVKEEIAALKAHFHRAAIVTARPQIITVIIAYVSPNPQSVTTTHANTHHFSPLHTHSASPYRRITAKLLLLDDYPASRLNPQLASPTLDEGLVAKLQTLMEKEVSVYCGNKFLVQLGLCS